MEQFASFHRSAQESCESLSPAQYAEVCVQKLSKCMSKMKCSIWAPLLWQQWFKASKIWHSHSFCMWKWSAVVEDCGFHMELGWIIVVSVLMLCWMSCWLPSRSSLAAYGKHAKESQLGPFPSSSFSWPFFVAKICLWKGRHGPGAPDNHSDCLPWKSAASQLVCSH